MAFALVLHDHAQDVWQRPDAGEAADALPGMVWGVSRWRRDSRETKVSLRFIQLGKCVLRRVLVVRFELISILPLAEKLV